MFRTSVKHLISIIFLINRLSRICVVDLATYYFILQCPTEKNHGKNLFQSSGVDIFNQTTFAYEYASGR